MIKLYHEMRKTSSEKARQFVLFEKIGNSVGKEYKYYITRLGEK